MVGLRISQIPLPGGSALVNGFTRRSAFNGGDSYAPAPYPVGADLAIEGRWLSDCPDSARFVRQEYDFSCGELSSVFTYSFGDITAEVTVLTLCNRRFSAIVQQETTVRVNRPCSVTLQAQIDPRGLPGTFLDGWHPKRKVEGLLLWESEGGLGTVGSAYLSEFHGADDFSRACNDFGHERDRFLTRYAFDAEPDKSYRLRQMGATVPGLMHGEPHLQAMRLVCYADWHGFESCREQNRQTWAELWKGRVQIEADDGRWQDLADSCFFYLHSSVSPASPCSVAPMGLSQSEAYAGHVFWDTETFMLPALLLSAPATARRIAEYRADRLGMARYNAMLNGCDGIQFPWQSGVGGWEVTNYYNEGLPEMHINVDVAFAMIQYVNATGDDIFWRQHAWPVVKGVADWLASVVEKTGRGYEIKHVTGVAENYPDIDNNSTLNMLGIRILREAVRWSEKLGLRTPQIWRAVAENMVLPLHEDGHLLPHDGYEFGKGGIGRNFGIGHPDHYCVEAMLSLFPFEQSLSPEVDQATLEHYLPRLKSYIGMPMLTANCAVWACRGGARKLALELLEGSYLGRQCDPFMMLTECIGFRQDVVDENFVTDQGGLITALMLGMTGLNVSDADPEQWARHPVVLPEGWKSIAMERIFARGEPYLVAAAHGAEQAEVVKV